MAWICAEGIFPASKHAASAKLLWNGFGTLTDTIGAIYVKSMDQSLALGGEPLKSPDVDWDASLSLTLYLSSRFNVGAWIIDRGIGLIWGL